MRASRFLQLFGLCLTMQAAAFSAHAQQAAKEAPPPKLEKLEEGDASAVTIRSAPANKGGITEMRAPGGKRTEVKVSTGNSTYYVKPNDQPGSALPGDGQSNSSRPAQWQILSWESAPNKKEQQAQATRNVPVPPPLTPPAAKPATNNK